jgi:phosphate transport system substrate-binding protein
MSSLRSCSNRICKVVVALLFAVSGTACVQGQQQTTASPDANAHLIRVWGYSGLSGQLLRWESAYRKVHPEIRFENQLHSPATVMAGLYNGVADIAMMGREIWPVETMAYRWVYQQQPFGVVVATTGLNGPGQSFTPVIVVNAKNPIASISLSQLDAIYGSEHRAAPANIRTWGELGLTGEWAAQPIHAYGFGPEDALGVFFRHDVLRSDFKPNPSSYLLSDHDASKTSAAQRIASAVAADPFAIGYTSSPHDLSVKVLALSLPDEIQPTGATVANHQYPLTRSVSLYFRRISDKPIEPKLEGFIRFVLSPEAQALIYPSEGFLPLTSALAQKQIRKLNDPMPKDSGSEEKDQ